MEDLEGLVEFVKTQKGITKITVEELIEFVPEYELSKLSN